MEIFITFMHDLTGKSAECANDLIVAAYVANCDLFHP